MQLGIIGVYIPPMYVCLCRAVSESDLRDALAAGVRDMDALVESLGVCTGCGTCRDVVEAFINEQRQQDAAASLGYAA